MSDSKIPYPSSRAAVAPPTRWQNGPREPPMSWRLSIQHPVLRVITEPYTSIRNHHLLGLVTSLDLFEMTPITTQEPNFRRPEQAVVPFRRIGVPASNRHVMHCYFTGTERAQLVRRECRRRSSRALAWPASIGCQDVDCRTLLVGRMNHRTRVTVVGQPHPYLGHRLQFPVRQFGWSD